jgi:hypothetical protein
MNASRTNRRRTLAFAAVGALAVVAGIAGPQVASSAASDRHAAPRLTRHQADLIRKATKRYRDVDAARAAGYVPTEECAALPGVGGMGYHYANPANLMDGVIDPAKPDLLLYHLDDDGELRLGGVEYFAVDADQDLTTDGDRPSLFGHAFDGPMPGHDATMPVHYDLHVWLYTKNPTGQLAPWNPRVTCPPEGAEHRHG